MKTIIGNSVVFCSVILFVSISTISAQDTLSNGKAFNFPTSKYGISIGNSSEFNGIRFNFADKNVKRINGLNITCWVGKPNHEAIVNGASMGVVVNEGRIGPVNLGILGCGANHDIFGITVGGFIVGSGGNVSGVTVAGLLAMADRDESMVSGIGISGFGLGAQKALNGLLFAGFAMGTDGNINGLAVCLPYMECGSKMNGIAINSGYFSAEIVNGLAVAGYSRTDQMNGLAIGIFNQTNKLYGLQLGLLNYAANNPKVLRWLPLINLHL